jgi:hypothetical protein
MSDEPAFIFKDRSDNDIVRVEFFDAGLQGLANGIGQRSLRGSLRWQISLTKPSFQSV